MGENVTDNSDNNEPERRASSPDEWERVYQTTGTTTSRREERLVQMNGRGCRPHCNNVTGNRDNSEPERRASSPDEWERV